MDPELVRKLRPIAREKADWFSQRVAAAASAGENTHRTALDLQDQVNEFTQSLPENERETFETLYLQEVEANTAAITAHADAIVRQADRASEQSALGAQILFAIVGIIVFVAAVLAIMRA